MAKKVDSKKKKRTILIGTGSGKEGTEVTVEILRSVKPTGSAFWHHHFVNPKTQKPEIFMETEDEYEANEAVETAEAAE